MSRITKLKILATIIQGQSPSSENYNSDYGVPFIQGNRTFGALYPFIDTYTSRVTKMAIKGDVLISVRAPVGDLNIADKDICIGRGIAAIRARKPELNNFIFYCLKYNIHHLLQQGSGTTYASVNRNILENLKLILPDKNSYFINIANILSTIDAKIELNNKINKELEDMAKLIYDYWFVQFDFPNEEGKPYKSSGGKMIYNGKIKREIPEGWEVKKLEDNLIEKFSTGLNPRDNFILGNGKIKYVTVKNLTTNSKIDFNSCDLIDKKAKSIVHARSDIKVDDILFASIAPLGRCYFISEPPKDWDINESVFSIRTNKEMLSPEFLYMFFKSEYFVKQAELSTTGSIFKGIRKQTLLSSLITLPPSYVLSTFSYEVKMLINKSNNLEKQNQQLTELRDWLLPILMNGQVTVK